MGARVERLVLPSLFGALLVAVALVERHAAALRPGSAHPGVLAVAIAVDLVVVFPFAFWLLVLRPRRARWWRALPVAGLGVLAARWLLPDQQAALVAARSVLSLGELAVVVLAVQGVRRAARALDGDAVDDVPERLARALEHALPPTVARLVATELALGWFAFLSWRRAPHVPPGARAFSTHDESGSARLFGALALVSAIELGAAHLLVHARWPRLAWLLAGASAFGLVWLVGMARAFVLRPVLLVGDRLVVRHGLLWTVELPLEGIERVGRDPGPVPRTRTTLRLGAPAEPNVLVTLARPVEARGLYGRRRQLSTLALVVDDAAALIAAVDGARAGQRAAPLTASSRATESAGSEPR